MKETKNKATLTQCSKQTIDRICEHTSFCSPGVWSISFEMLCLFNVSFD